MTLMDASAPGAFWSGPLARLDQELFHLLNGKWHNSFLDSFLPYMRESIIWIPLYLFLFVLAWSNFGKKGLGWIVFAILTAALTDIVSSGIIKEMIPRFRPCNDPQLAHSVRFLVLNCPKNSSFTSSHAASHFGAAMFIFQTYRYIWNKAWIAFLWAGMISYAQVYVGVHFPLDILCGALIGCGIGWGTSLIFNRQIGLRTFDKLSTQS